MVGRTGSSTGTGAGNEHVPARRRETRRHSAAELARLIEAEVIPRMMFAHGRPALAGAVEPGGTAPDEHDVARLVGHVLRDDDTAVFDCVDTLIARGVPLERVFLGLLGPTARRLGEMWEADTCSFTEVTLGLIRLQQLLRRYAPRFNDGSASGDPTRRVLLNALPGEQHTFGLFMLAEFFRRAGWDVDEQPLGSATEIASVVGDHWYAMIGLSVSSDNRINELANLILDVRERSLNPNLGVMVGGCLFSEHPALVEFVGADIGGRDAADSIDEAEYLFEQLHAAHR
jgi:methanogenic corrinoid protein MtbC1